MQGNGLMTLPIADLRRQKKGFIVIRSLVLFVHITGVLTMCAGLALEAYGAEAAGKPVPRLFGPAAPLTVLSGLYLGARVGVLGNDWIRASYGGIVAMICRRHTRASVGGTAANLVVGARGVWSGCRVLDDCEARGGGVLGRARPGIGRVDARRTAQRIKLTADRPVVDPSMRP